MSSGQRHPRLQCLREFFFLANGDVLWVESEIIFLGLHSQVANFWSKSNKVASVFMVMKFESSCFSKHIVVKKSAGVFPPNKLVDAILKYFSTFLK